MTTADRIRTARIARGLRQSDLAALCCCSLRAISFYEQGRRRPIPAIREMLELVLEVRL